MEPTSSSNPYRKRVRRSPTHKRRSYTDDPIICEVTGHRFTVMQGDMPITIIVSFVGSVPVDVIRTGRIPEHAYNVFNEVATRLIGAAKPCDIKNFTVDFTTTTKTRPPDVICTHKEGYKIVALNEFTTTDQRFSQENLHQKCIVLLEKEIKGTPNDDGTIKWDFPPTTTSVFRFNETPMISTTVEIDRLLADMIGVEVEGGE